MPFAGIVEVVTFKLLAAAVSSVVSPPLVIVMGAVAGSEAPLPPINRLPAPVIHHNVPVPEV